MTDKFEFLYQHPLFEYLDEDEVVALAAISDEYEFEDGAVIAYQRDVANSLYMVKNGRLFAHTVDERGIVRDSHSYFENDCFGDAWLFVTDAHPATVKAVGDGRLIIIEGRRFLEFLEENPSGKNVRLMC